MIFVDQIRWNEEQIALIETDLQEFRDAAQKYSTHPRAGELRTYIESMEHNLADMKLKHALFVADLFSSIKDGLVH